MNLKRRISELLPMIKYQLDISNEIKVIIFRMSNREIINKKYNTPDNKPLPLYISMMCPHRWTNKLFLFYNLDFWNDAIDEELRGNIAHELCHVLLKKSNICKYVSPHDCNKDQINFSIQECMVDLIAANHGFIDDMILSKKYLSKKLARIENTPPSVYFKHRKKYRNGEVIIGIPINTFKYIKSVKNSNFGKEIINNDNC